MRGVLLLSQNMANNFWSCSVHLTEQTGQPRPVFRKCCASCNGVNAILKKYGNSGLGFWRPVKCIGSSHHHHHLSLNRDGRWGTTDDFTTSFLYFSLFSTALWDLANSRPIHFLMLSSHLFHSLLFLLPLSLCLARWFWPDLMNGRHDHTSAVCVSLRWPGGLHVVQLPAESWHGLPRW